MKGSLRRNKEDSDRTPLLPKDVQVQNAKAAKVYVFGDADVAEEELQDDVHEMSELRPRGKARVLQREVEAQAEAEPHFVERNLTEGDTLQSISLKFGVPVSGMKAK